MTDDTYNGWTNYDTWNVKLWIDNDEGLYGYWQEITQDIVDQYNIIDKTETLAERLCEEFEETGTPDTAAMHCVDWMEIAESMLDGIEFLGESSK